MIDNIPLSYYDYIKVTMCNSNSIIDNTKIVNFLAENNVNLNAIKFGIKSFLIRNNININTNNDYYYEIFITIRENENKENINNLYNMIVYRSVIRNDDSIGSVLETSGCYNINNLKEKLYQFDLTTKDKLEKLLDNLVVL
jgi:hypothetical protein